MGRVNSFIVELARTASFRLLCHIQIVNLNE